MRSELKMREETCVIYPRTPWSDEALTEAIALMWRNLMDEMLEKNAFGAGGTRGEARKNSGGEDSKRRGFARL